jgi:hypothetical protein
MRTIWWFVIAVTLGGGLFERPQRPSRTSGGGSVHAMDGSGEPPKPPKP